ncbi:MAG TPA: CDP-diacylglycerol--glycerol-3-phosphate 3-phosphatidyltransferase [Feifaniaceae bacterium]|nr:CDP-diacylglycerol--glycerol-3-phosphate 3-phosphatidyltransferase [Feifaniaceae bacterium]
MNLPNKLTILRMLLVPVFVACFYIPAAYADMIAAGVYLLAYLTDILDGQIARKRNLITSFGKLMDPMADKLLTCSAFIMLSARALVSPIAVIIIIARELFISGFRLVAVESGNVIAASWLGKIKTISQCVAVITALVWPYLWPAFPLDDIIVWISVGFTLWSGIDYVVKNKASIKFS